MLVLPLDTTKAHTSHIVTTPPEVIPLTPMAPMPAPMNPALTITTATAHTPESKALSVAPMSTHTMTPSQPATKRITTSHPIVLPTELGDKTTTTQAMVIGKE